MDKTNSDSHLIQFLLLWWTKHSPFNGTALSSILLQHHVGCYEEGGRAIELLHRSSEDLKALSNCTDIMHDHYDRDDCSQHITGAYWVADRSEQLGSCYAARVSFCESTLHQTETYDYLAEQHRRRESYSVPCKSQLLVLQVLPHY